MLTLGERGIFAPSVADAGSAVIASQYRFDALYLSGFALEVALLGAPDMGILTLTELVEQARRITAVSSVPLIVDAETGFGWANNIDRCVRLLEAAGAAAIHIEDQANPKSCPIIPGARSLADIEEATARISAAVAAKTDPAFKIIARSDGDMVSAEESIVRCNSYLSAGADAALPMTMDWEGKLFSAMSRRERLEVFRLLVREIEGPVAITNTTPDISAQHLFDLGVSIVLYPDTFRASVSTYNRLYAELASSGSDANYFREHPAIPETILHVLKLYGLDDYVGRHERFDRL